MDLGIIRARGHHLLKERYGAFIVLALGIGISVGEFHLIRQVSRRLGAQALLKVINGALVSFLRTQQPAQVVKSQAKTGIDVNRRLVFFRSSVQVSAPFQRQGQIEMSFGGFGVESQSRFESRDGALEVPIVGVEGSQGVKVSRIWPR